MVKNVKQYRFVSNPVLSKQSTIGHPVPRQHDSCLQRKPSETMF